ncbi:MAG: carboxylating nicotinate-nucleotide diphosphorylase [Firmicutes bacterium]|nr:carboxylating nicotinate-nucleotide diphosphorylase [Bacillota bacterium]
MNPVLLAEIVKTALIEDVQSGDITSEAIFQTNSIISGAFISKEAGVIAGLPVAAEVFRQLDPHISFTTIRPDGTEVSPGDQLASVTGPVRTILTGERTALNFLRRLSGIASQTARMVKLVQGLPVKIADTRKTTPGLRLLEKYAVRQGGGFNHRFGLADAVLIKDNHIAACGSIQEAVRRARQYIPHTMTIEVEVENEAQLREALTAGADIVLLDNMPPAEMARLVQLIKTLTPPGQRILVEASGNIDESNVQAVAQSGVDIISSGALTHSADALDISLDI